MTAVYRTIDIDSEPFDIGLDSENRQKTAFNFRVVKQPSDVFVEEIVGLLVTAGVGVFGTNIFASSKANIPSGAGPFLSIVETGGTAPERTQNEIGPPAYTRPSAQITVRATKYSEARTMARAAYNALVGVRNTNVPG